MFRLRSFAPLAFAALLAFTAGSAAHMAGKGDLEIIHPWAEPSSRWPGGA